MKVKSLFKNGVIVALCAGSLFTGVSCSTWNKMSQSGQGAAAGGTIGAAVGTGVGALIGGGKGTWIGALVGGALGAGTGALVGNSMDKQKKELEAQLGQLQQQTDANTDSIDKNSQAIKDIKVEMVKDRNNLDAIKLVMGNSVLFATSSSKLSAEAQAALARVAYNLKQFPNTDVTVIGYTDNTGSEQLNQRLSLERAQSVVNDLISLGIPADRLQAVGKGWDDPIASNATPEGRAQNRRVEIYITADKKMIEQAQQQAQ